MITDKRVIERLREYADVFMPVFLMLHTELGRPNTTVDKLAELLDYNDAEMAYLDFTELVNNIQSSKRKLSSPTNPPKSEGAKQ